MVGLKDAVQRLPKTEQRLKDAKQAFDLAQARYKAARASLVELTDAQVNESASAVAEADACFDTLIQRATLDCQTRSLR